MTAGLAALSGSRLLFLNWRDRTHPRAGGAELYAESIAEQLSAHGADVTLFTAHHERAPLAETSRNGIRILRRGGTFGVYAAALRYLRRTRGEYDAVVDFQNGIPFFAPLATGSRVPVILVLHHVHQDQFRQYFPPLVSSVGRFLEGPVSRLVYQGRPLVAVSPSTRQELRQRLQLAGPVFVVPNGVDPLERRGQRASEPRIAVVTRLVPHKRLHLLIEAVAELCSGWPGLTVDIGGDGPDRERLEQISRALGLTGRVRFHGYVSDERRERLLSEAWLTVLPSEAEGWGLTVLEAASIGTPAVAYRVPGLRDSVLDGETGWLCSPNASLAACVDHALVQLSDADRADQIAERCRRWAENFTWEGAADRMARVIVAEIDRLEHAPASRRRDVDLAVQLSFEAPQEPTDIERRLRAQLRATDRMVREGARIRVVMHGTDEVGAVEAVRRAGFDGEVSVGLIGPSELLLEDGMTGS